jgi:hypothetical protein
MKYLGLWKVFLIENPVVAKLVNKFHAFYGNRMFIIMFMWLFILTVNTGHTKVAIL